MPQMPDVSLTGFPLPTNPHQAMAWRHETAEYADLLTKLECSVQDHYAQAQVHERDDVLQGEQLCAARAYLDALHSRRVNNQLAFLVVPAAYPTHWSGFRDQGSDIANLVTAAAFIRQEIIRLLRAGEPFYRTRHDGTMPNAQRDSETQSV